MNARIRSSMRTIGTSAAFAAAFFAFSALLASPADAALIKRVQRGTALFDNADVQQSISLSYAVDQTKSIILLTSNTQGTNADQNYFFTSQFADNQTISIDRAGGTIASSVVWQVIEFEEGVSVQTGVTTMQSTGSARLIKSISIAAVSANAVPIVQVRAPFTDGSQSHEMHLLPTFTNSTTLKLERKDATGTKGISINWQVIDFLTDVTVTAGTTLIPASSDADDAADIDVDLAGAAANPLLFTYFVGNYNVNGEDDSEMTTAEYVTGSPNVLRFKRYDNSNSVGNDVFIAYYLVDFTDDASFYQAGNTAAGAITWASGASNQLTIASAGSRTIDTQANGGVQDTTPITIKTTANHGFSAGDYVTIAGATSTGLTVNATDGTGVANTTPVRIQTTTNHGLSTGDKVFLTGTTMDAFTVHGTYNTGIQDPATANIPIRIRTTANHSFTTGQKVNFTGTIQWQAGSRTIATKANGGISNTTPIRIKTTVAHGYKSDSTHHPKIVITGAGIIAINGVWDIDVIDSDEFDLIGSSASGESGGGTVNPTISPSVNISSVANTTPILVTTSTVHGLTASSSVNLAGSTLTAVNGTWTVTPVTTTTFTLNGSTALGSAGANGTVTINWPITVIDGDEFYLDGSGGSGAGRGNTGTVTSVINGIYNITYSGVTNQFTLDGTTASGTGANGTVTPFVASGYVNNGWVIESTPALNTFTLQGSTKVGPGGGGTVTGSTISGINKRASGQTIRVNTTATHGLATGDIVCLSGTGDLSLEGNWPVIYNSTTSFFLAGSDSINLTADTGAGTIQKPQTGSTLTAIVPSRTIDTLTTRAQQVAGGTTYRVGDDMALAGWLKTDITNPDTTTTQYQTLRGVNATNMALKSNYMVTELSPLKITAPNGSESWAVGSVQNVTWLNSADTASHDWKLQMSVDGGAYSDLTTGCTAPNYNSACSGTGNLSTRAIAWKVPDNLSTNVKLRIIDTTMTGGGTTEVRSRDTSNNAFTIKRSVTLTSPVGAEEWVVGSSHDITWDYTGQTSWGNVKILYSTNNGSSYPDPTNLLATVAVNNGSAAGDTPPFAGKGRWAWTIPDAIGTQVKVRVISSTDAAIFSDSPAAFTIKRSIALTQPGMTGGEIFTAQTPWDIRWTYTGQTGWGNVGLYYSTDAAHSNWTLFDTVSVGSSSPTTYNSTNIPLGAVGSTVKIKACSVTDPTVCTQSSNDFTVTAKITADDIVAPSGLKVDDSQLITWTISGGGIANVKIEFWDGTQWVVPAITDSTNAINVDSTHGSYNWTVPNSIGVGRKIRVSNAAIPSVNDETATFEIKGQITNLYPSASGIVLNYGSTPAITWAAHGTIGNVDVVLSTDGVTFPRPANTLGTVNGTLNSFDWSMGTTAIGSSYKIRVIATSDSAVYVDSANNFSVKGTLSVTAPTGSDVWYANETNRNITWTKNPGTLGVVNIEYSTNGGSNWNSLATGQSGTSYNWNPLTNAGLPDAGVTVRVSLASDSTVNATSASFKIRGKLTLTAPSASGLTWEVGTSQTITWTSDPLNQGSVELSYSDDGSPFTVITECASVASANQSCTWNSVPDAISSNVIMRIKSLNSENENTVTDDSDNAFTIRPRYLIVSPNGSEEWKVGETRNITWKHWGTVDKVKLYYSSSGSGGPWNLIASAVSDTGPADGSVAGSFDWSTVGGVADMIGTTGRIKVESNYDSTATDISDANFTVRGNVTLSALPATLRVGASQVISFTKTGSMNGINPDFKIYYATDGTTFTDPDNLIATVSGTSATWNPIPDAARSDTAKIKVQWQGDAANVNSISSTVAIKPSITINQPTGGTYHIGDALPIQFTHTGRTSDTFRFRYSIDNGSTWTTIDTATSIAPNTPYTHATWNVPNVANVVAGSGQFKIRVELVGDEANTSGDSAGNTILGSLGTVSLSSGGTGWTAADTTRQISWTRQGITEVKVEYTLDNGTDNYANSLATGLTADSFTWSAGIPGSAVSDQVKFRVTAQDANDSVTSATSSMITIKPQLILVQPNGPTTRNVGSPLTISWTSSGAGNIKVEYTMDANVGSPTWQTLAGYSSIDSTPQSDTSATVPDAVSSHVKFRLSNVTVNPNLQVSSTSNTEFTVQTALTLDALTGPYTLGDTVNVTWTPSGSVGAVTVEYYNGASWNVMTTSAPQNGPYSLLLDSANGITNATNLARVRVSATNGLATPSTSSAFIVKPYLSVTSPAGNESWVVDSSNNIAWTIKGSNVSQVAIYYSKNSGSTYTNMIIDPLNINFAGGNNMTYPWSIPDDIQATKNMKVKVQTLPLSDPWAVEAVSNGLFQIVGALAMKTPDDTTPVAWRVGSTQDVEWTNVHGSVSAVKLEYSTNSGSNWSTLISSTTSGGPGDHAYSWAIPNSFTIVKDNFRIRVSDASNSNVVDPSTAASSILANFAFAHPLSGEVWVAENTHTIEWTTPVAGVPANVKIEYNVGSGWTNLPENDGTANDGIVTNTGSVNWTLPVNRTAAAQIRISDPADSASTVTSNNFKIRGDFTMTAPNSGIESWDIASTHNITWTKKGNVSTVKLQFSNNGGSTWSALVDGNSADTQNIDVSGAGPYTFSWKIPDIAGQTTTQALVRVVDASDSTVYDPSDNNFTIKGNVHLDQPNGGEVLGVGNVYSVSGVVNGIGITSVRIYYSTNGGGTYPNGLNEVSGGQIVSVVGGTFSQNWSVPNQIGSNLKVRVEDATNSLVYDESDAAFAVKGTVALTSPTNLSVWSAGSTQNIVWDRNGNVGNVDLYYQVNGGAWNSIATSVSSPNATGNTYPWTLPTSGIVSTNVKVKIDGANLLQPEVSQAFNVKGAIAITYPDASGISFTLGDPLTVTWSQSGSIGDVKVEYYDGSGWTTVTTTAPQDGPYQFTLDSPITTVATAGAKVRVSQASDATVTSTSANAFMVKPLVLITSPAGNEAWVVDSSHNITWNKIGSNVSNVKIEYSKNSGSTFTDVIQATVSNNGSYSWTIPDDIQSVKNMKVRVSTLPLSDLYAVQAVSSGLFQIVGQLAMKVPDDTTPIQWAVGSTNNTITWTNVHGSIANVKLEYSTNAGSSWSTLSATEPSGGPGDHSYSWNVPNNFTIVKDNFRIRVSDAANSAVVDASDAASSILASFTFTHPLSGEVWVAENTHEIDWTTPVAGVPSTVKIEYNVGSGWALLPENDGTANDGIVTNSGSVNWTLPATRTPSAQLRISDPNDSASAVTSANFKIRGDLTVTSPNTGAESWEIATAHAITWTKKGDISSVKLQFSNDGGSNWSALVDGNSADTQNIDVSGAGPYSFNWTIPDIAGITTTQARIKVIDASDSTVYDSSNNNFTTKGRVDLTTPNGGETLGVGNTYAVTGDVFGQGITSVRLYYSTNGGATYPYGLNEVGGGQVVSVSGGAFSQNWSVPDHLGSNLKVRVEDATNSLVADESATAFSIKGTVAITSPTNLSVWAAGSQQNIVWDRNGTVGNVDLYYQVNNGTWNTIATSVASPSSTGNTYPWTLPTSGVVSTNVKVKIDGANLLNPDISQAFTVKGAIALTYPDAANIVLTLGDPLNVTWSQTGSIGNVKVEYFNGTSWSTLTTTAGEDGPYQFTLDSPITTVATAGAKVRISQANDASVTDTSANDFMVKPFLQVTSPSGNEAWVVGTPHNVTWNFKGSNVSNVKIEYSKDSGSTYSDVIDPSTANDGSLSWTMPDDIRPTKDMKIKISSLPTSDLYAVTAVSSGLFQIVGALEMVVPDDATPVQWRVGSADNEIKWNATGSIATVKIEYSNNAGSTWSTLTPTANSGAGANKSYSWDIPNNQTIVKDNFRIRVLDSANTNVYDAADAASSILASFSISHPVNADVWTAQTPYDVQWSTPVAGVPSTIKLEYDLGSGYQTIDAGASNSGTYNWTLPAGLSTAARVRISDPNDAASAVVSDPFKIRGSLTLTSPTAGDAWVYNTHHNITWTKLGSITAVKLEYTTNGSSYTTIATGVDPATGTPFDWTVPDVMSQTVQVKVTDASDASVYSQSGNFTIKGTLTMTAPNGGEGWVVGTVQNIAWSKTGSISAVDLAYSTNGGGTYPNSIATGVSASAPYPWTIPDAIGSQLRVKVTDAANGSVSDVSDADFSVKGALTLTAPNGGEILSVGSNSNITWTRTGSIANIKIDYSTDGGSTYPNSIASVVGASDGSYPWTVPDALSLTAKVKITDTTDSSVFDVSNGNFTIRGALTVIAPNGGEVWKVGQQQDIVWQRFGSITDVKLEYSTNGGSTYPNTIISSTGAAAGTYTWTIPDSITIQAKVRITDVNDSGVFDVSDANFAIKGTLTVTSPNGGEAWGVGTNQNITWNRQGSIANVKIEYSTDGGATYPVEIINATDAAAGSFTWTIPDDLSITCRVKVTSTADATVFDASNANFKIVGALFLTAPDTGEGWAIGTNQNITWTRTGSIQNVKIELSTNGGSTFPTQISPSEPAGGLSYNWAIPDIPTTTAKIRISDANDATVNDVSAVNFKIQGTFNVTSPNAGTEVWDVNSSHDITWTKVGSVASVRIEYSTDGGTNYGNVVVTETNNNGSYSWTIPDAITSGARVRISDINDYSAFDVSNQNFTIRGVLTLTAPNGGEDWDVASHHDVTWTRVGSISTVKLEYSTDGGSTYPGLIHAGLSAALGTYDWTIPDVLSTTMKVKITDTSNSSVTDSSNLNFTIKGALTVNSPNGGEQWIVNSGHNITWTRFGAIAEVKIDYSTDGGTTFPNSITTGTDASQLSFAWTVPDDISTTVRVRVMDTSNSNVFDVSNANFAIRGSFTVVAPNGGETWVVGESRNITWNRQGTIANAKLEYSTNGGSTYPNVIIGVQDAATGTYAWTIPDAIGSNVRVKISDVNNPAVFDESNADFIIKGSLTLTAPNGSETWIVGAVNNVTWNRSGTISSVKLEYSTNGGSTYPNTINPGTNGLTGTFAWTVADAISTQVRVRVSDVSDPSVIDASDANFTVKGSITVTSPNGGEAWVVGTSHPITWTKTGTLSTVSIDYSTNGGSTYPNSIATSVTASAGTHPWTIPDDIQSTVRVRVTNNADTTVADASDTNFKITGAFTLTAPNGSEQWKVGQNNNVTWTKVGSISQAKLELSLNGGSTFPITITSPSTPAGALSFSWSVPDNLTQQARVRISDASDATVFDVSDANFEIQASFTITSPNGGEVWTVASAQDITWNKVGSATNVVIEYSTNGGSTYPNVISSNSNNTGSFTWTVPDSISSSVKVRVSDLSNASAYDVSDGNFKIRGSVTVTAPNGSESWNVASAQNITWTKVGSIATVKLEYSTDSGTTYPNLIYANVTATDLTYAWTVPDAITANAKVKITDASDSTVFDESNAVFRIRGVFTVTQPNGSEVLDVGSVYTIKWTKIGSIADAKLEYSSDGGGTYPNVIVGSIDPADLQFDWTVPDAISTLVRVRIVDNNDSVVKDSSDANLKIRGVLTLTSPNGSEVWNVASVHNITWTRLGSVTTAKLEYSTNSGSTYPNVIITPIGANLLTYAWTVPDSISTTLRVKITNLSDATVTDSSDSDFKIAGVLTLTSPNGSEVWSVGSSQAISWTRIGSISTAKLEYSSDGGVNYNTTITSSAVAANQSFGWTVPDVISATMRVRISDASDATVFDISDGNFKIRGAFTLTSPNGNEGWVIGSSRNITWTRFGSIADAKLEYSTNGGTTFPNVIIGSVDASLLTYNWAIPDNATTQARVRISQVGDSTVYDDSDANFVIRAGFTVTAPVGGEAWAVGSSHDITWVTGGTISSVKLEYSTNGGNSYTTIIGTTTNNQTYPWVVPDAITTQARIKVSDVNDAQASDISPANFKIHGTFALTSPNGAEQWLVGSSHNITWTKTGSIGSAKLEYSTNGGTSYPNLINGTVSASNLSYSWTIPDRIGSGLKVKITDLNDTTVFDESDSSFTIKAAFTITGPNGGENWVVGTNQNIVWGTLGTVSTVKLEYATDGGTAYNTINSNVSNSGTYSWTVPDAITTQARVRVSDVSDSSAFDASDNNFKIRGSLTITAPNGAEKWNVGTNRIITWDRTGSIPTVKLEYSSNNGTVYSPIDLNANNTGSYSWTIPDSITTQALVRITDTADNTVTDVSNASFKIMGNFTVTSPNGGEVWTITSSRDITWTSSGTMNFAKIDYSTDGGATFPNQIIGSTTNNGLYNWTVPDGVSGQVRIRVSDPNDPDAFDDSNANFRIRMTFTLTAPNGGQKWPVASSRNITWTNVGTISNVKLQFSRDGFLGDIVTIHAGAPNTGSFAWTIPDAISSTVRVRVSDPNDIGAFDDSNNDFKIMGGFTVTSPNGSEKWDVNSTHAITWTPTGTVSDAKIEYSVDGGATYPYVIGATPNTGSYDWLVPDTISAAVKVRVSDLNDSADAFDVSDANAKIRAKFTLTAPNGGQIWTVGDSNNITWTTVGTVSSVKLDYSTDSGSTFPGSIQTSVSNTGTYAWTVPDAISTNVRVRVMSATDVDAFDASDANLKIRGKFAITAPNGGEQWKIAQSNNITWVTTGTIADVKITYSLNGGSTFPTTIVPTISNANTYAWTVPDTPTALARIHVENVADATVYDESDANFSIQGFFTLTAPNGGEALAVASAYNIAWTWGGTIPQVKLTYSTDGGSTYPNVIQATTSNGAGSGGNHSYSWTVPDTISPTVRVKVEDPNDNTVFDVSNANLKIVGHFTVTAPDGGERWVTYETRNITWNTDGTIPVVKLEYSYDNFTTPVLIDATAPNTGTYAWTLPDPGIANIPKAAKVRVTDVNDTTVFDVSNATFNVDYYYITWEVRDLLTNAALSALSVVEVKSSDPQFIQWSEAGIAANPPRVQPTPYGTWVATWSKTGYGEVAQVVIADQDQSILLYMETSAVHIWLADSRVSYDADADKMDIVAWLSRDGSITTGGISSTYKIYDGATLLYTLNDNTIDAAGFFNFQVNSPTGFVAGKTYTAICEVAVGSGGVFKTPTSFEVSTPKTLEDVKDTINANIDKPLSQINSELQLTLNAQTAVIQQKLDDQSTVITTKLDQQTTIIQQKLDDFEASIQTSIVKLEDAAVQAQESAQTLQDTALKFSWKAVVAPNPALSGDKILLQAQGPSGLHPYLSVYNHKNKQVIANGLMNEDRTRPGNYDFEFKANAGDFDPGQAYTYIVTEDVTGGLVAGSGFVESISLTSVAGLASSAPAAEKAAKEAVEAIRELESTMAKGGDIRSALKTLQKSVLELPGKIESGGGETKAMRNTVDDISKRIQKLAGEQGLDLSEIVGKAIDESATVQDIGSRSKSIEHALELLGAVVQKRLGGAEDPIVATFLE